MASTMPRSLALRPLSSRPCLSRGVSPARCLSSTSKDLPPESPLFVDVPRPPQPSARSKPIVKGVLPTPRNMFHPTGPERATPKYFAKTSGNPKSPKTAPKGKDQEYVAYKYRMTEMRKKSIRDGLSELKARNEEAIEAMSVRSSRKQKINYENLMRPERDDDRLTAPTILPTVESMVSKPLTQEEIDAKRERYEAKVAAKREERMNNLHTLYVNARDFIVTEDQLNERIDAVFDDPFWENQIDPSIWGKEGVPEQIRDIVAQRSGERSGAMDLAQSYTLATRQRLQAIAEELTGGRMEDEARVDRRAGREPLH